MEVPLSGRRSGGGSCCIGEISLYNRLGWDMKLTERRERRDYKASV